MLNERTKTSRVENDDDDKSRRYKGIHDADRRPDKTAKCITSSHTAYTHL